MNYEKNIKLAQDYTEMVSVLFKPDGTKKMQQHATLGLVSELGELADAYKISYYKELPLDVNNIKEELGDIVFYKVAQTTINAGEHYVSTNIKNVLNMPTALKGSNAIRTVMLMHKNALTDPLIQVLQDITSIGSKYNFTLQDILEHNIFKLTDSKKGRYQNGEFSLKAALKRNDKK